MRAGDVSVDRAVDRAFERPSRARRALFAALATTALAVSGAGVALPAAAHDVPLPADAADWPTPYSPLPERQVLPSGNTVLEFDGTGEGLHDATGTHTGFTLVQPSSGYLPSADGTASPELDADYYIPANLSVAGDMLTVAATKGTALGTQTSTDESTERNRQDNALGVALEPGESTIRMQTTVVNPTGIHGSAQAGLWFGPDDENYLKLAFVANGSAGDPLPRQVQLKREIGGGDQTDATSQITADIVYPQVAVPVESLVHLTLDIDPVALTATGIYQFGSSTPVSMGTVTIPKAWLAGQIAGAPAGVESIGGIFATKNDMAAASQVMFAFDSFSVTEVDSTPPAAVTGLAATGAVGAIDLAWTAPDDEDVAGYRVFRSATSDIDLSGEGIGGEDLITEAKFTDAQTVIGETWHYAVVAFDEWGNASSSATATGSSIVPAGTLVTSTDFTGAAPSTGDEHQRDLGLSYGGRGYGWISDEVWEHDVAPGRYRVLVLTSDAQGSVAVDGVVAEKPSVGEDGLAQRVVDVEVTDGKLTLAVTDPVLVQIYEVKRPPAILSPVN